jgi:hypothetical protein
LRSNRKLTYLLLGNTDVLSYLLHREKFSASNAQMEQAGPSVPANRSRRRCNFRWNASSGVGLDGSRWAGERSLFQQQFWPKKSRSDRPKNRALTARKNPLRQAIAGAPRHVAPARLLC